MTLKVSLTLQPAVHETFHDLISIEAEINGLFPGENDMFLDEDDDDSEARKVLNDMAVGMRVKFEKYWGNLDKINQLLMVALVLDPRYKMGNLSHVLEHYCMDAPSASRKIKEIKTILVNLYDEYAIPPTEGSNSNASGVTSNDDSTCSTETSREPKGGKKRLEMTQGWMKKAAASNVVILDHEVDRYLMDPIEQIDPNVDFDILKWWKLNGVKYPGLSRVAKDILAIPVSTVASEACFSTGGRIVNSFRASLTPKMVEALICCQNWLRSADIASLQHEPTIEEMEFYEAIETEFVNSTSRRKMPLQFFVR